MVQLSKKLAKTEEQESAAKKFQLNSELARLKGKRVKEQRARLRKKNSPGQEVRMLGR